MSVLEHPTRRCKAYARDEPCEEELKKQAKPQTKCAICARSFAGEPCGDGASAMSACAKSQKGRRSSKRSVVSPRVRLRAEQGVTLLEISVVMVIIALLASGAVTGLRAVNKSDLRSACSKVVAGSRFAYSRAVTQGNTVRMLFDFRNATMAVEETDVAVALTDPEAENLEDDEAEVVDPWAAAEARLSGTFNAEGHNSPFSAISGRDGQPRDKYKAEKLADGVTIRKLITPHEPDARTEGQGAVYFFPGGIGERAIIQLAQGETVYSVAIHPLTGAAKVYNYAYEPEDLSASDLDGD